MAQFIGEVQGSRGAASRLGSKQSGIVARAQGWDVGARVTVDHIDGKDVVRVFRTSGSGGWASGRMIAQFDADTPLGGEFVQCD